MDFSLTALVHNLHCWHPKASIFSSEIILCCFVFFLGMVAALTNESATGKSVYFAHCTSEMIFITHLLTKEPEKLAGPLLADTYVTLLKGRNAWYGQMIAKGQLSIDMGDSISGKGTIQVSTINTCSILYHTSRTLYTINEVICENLHSI